MLYARPGRGDPVTRLYRLNDQLFETDYASDKTFFLDGFSDFTAVQLQILQTLLPQADITLTLQTGCRSSLSSPRQSRPSGR